MIGIIFDSFAPFCKDQQLIIDKSLECDEVIIAVCGSDEDKYKDFIPFKKRVSLMKKRYENNPRFTVVAIDETKNNLETDIFTKAKINPNCGVTFVWYLTEKKYVKKLSKIYTSHHSFLYIESKTDFESKIRKNFRVYKDKIDPVFYEYLDKKFKLPKEVVAAKAKRKHHTYINDWCSVVDDVFDTLLDAYQQKDWKMSWDEFLTAAQEEIDDFFDNTSRNLDE